MSIRTAAAKFRLAILSGGLLLQACTTDAAKKPEAEQTPADPTMVAEAPPPPIGSSVYHCANGTDLAIDNLGSSVRVTDAAGESIDMPASPPDSRYRYVHAQHAIVLDGDEALFMKPRGGPIACKR